MSNSVIVQFVRCEVKAQVREYTFTVREPETVPRDFTLTIANEAFSARRARFQDAPDICSLKLHRELAASENHPPKTHFRLTDLELDDYRIAHSPKSQLSPYSRKPKQDF